MARRLGLGILAAALSAMAALSARAGPADLIVAQPGGLPVVLSAPHGGQEPVPGVAPRSIEGRNASPSSRQYNLGRDIATDALTLAIADEIGRLTGKRPYVLVARFERRFIDANRPPHIAYDGPAAKPTYDAYHAALRGFVDEVRSRHGSGVLLDIHAQNREPGLLMRGTRNGQTVKTLIARSGFEAITGPQGLFGLLEANGFAVFPANSVPPAGTAENAGLAGGFTVDTYGSHHAGGIDAIQLEFGGAYRSKATLETSAKSTARAIVAFYRAYLM